MADSQNNMSVFTTNLINMQDLAKAFLFQVRFIYEKGSALSAILDTDDFMIKARTASLPQKSFNELDTQYMGSKLIYPGKATVSGDFSVQFDEFQDMRISIALHQWTNMIFNQGFNNDISTFGNLTGGAISNQAKDYTATTEILLYDSTLRNLLPVKWVLYRVWPKQVNSFGLDHNGEAKITREATFSYSNFEVVYT